MSRPTLRPCAEPGCPELVRGQSRCPDHRRETDRPTSGQRGYGRRWRKTRDALLAKHPWCRRCGAKAKHAHHVDGLGPNGPRGHDESNFEPLCGSCHSRVTAEQQPGGWNPRRDAA